MMDWDNKYLTARYALYEAIETMASKADMSKPEAAIIIAEYAVELASFLINDGAKIRELCESAALDGMEAKRAFLAREAQKEAS